MTIERRISSGAVGVTRRSLEDGTEVYVIQGHAAVFDKESEDLGGFVEKIAPGAFSDVLSDDVRALFNHDSNKILGRSPTTLTIKQDEQGLFYECVMPKTTYANDLVESIGRGDVNQSSFAFFVGKDEWIHAAGGKLIRVIHKISRLFDVSPVTYPAYPDATVALRSMEQFLNSEKKPAAEELELRRRKIELVRLGGA